MGPIEDVRPMLQLVTPMAYSTVSGPCRDQQKHRPTCMLVHFETTITSENNIVDNKITKIENSSYVLR